MSEEVKEESKKEESKTAQLMVANESGILAPKDIGEAYRYAKMICESKLAPNQFDTPEKVLVAMQTAKELGLPALTSLRSMYVVNGTVSLWGGLPLALVRRSGLLESFSEKQYDKDGKELHSDESASGNECVKATCKLKRKGDSEEIVRTVTWKEIQDAGIDKNKWGLKDTYKNHRKRMLQMRARSWALNDGFSDVLQGIAIFEYDHFESKEKDVSPVDAMNERLGLKNEQ